MKTEPALKALAAEFIKLCRESGISPKVMNVVAKAQAKAMDLPNGPVWVALANFAEAVVSVEGIDNGQTPHALQVKGLRMVILFAMARVLAAEEDK